MFDDVAPTYDITNALLSFGQDARWRKIVRKAVAPKSGQKVLDLAAGTGASSVAFALPGVKVVAGDFSEGMLAVGRKRHPEIEFVFADATALPFADAEFDAVTISFGLRNTQNPTVALAEAYRVVKPGGRMVVIEFSHPTNKLFRTIYMKYLMRALPIIARKTSSNPDAYVYLAESIQAWPDQKGLARVLESAGWQMVTWKDLTFGIVAIHIGHKPL